MKLPTVIREPSLKLGFVPFVVDWADDVSSIAYRSFNSNIASSPALLHQVEALTTSVDARRKTRPVAKLNFILTDWFSFRATVRGSRMLLVRRWMMEPRILKGPTSSSLVEREKKKKTMGINKRRREKRELRSPSQRKKRQAGMIAQ